MNFIENNSKVNAAETGYLFGLQQQAVHFIQFKTRFITDLLASLLNRFPHETPANLVCTFSDTSSDKLGCSFSFKGNSDTASTDAVNVLDNITNVVQGLALQSTVSADMDFDDMILSSTHQKQAIVKAKILLESLFEIYGVMEVDSSSSFEKLMSALVDKVSVTTLSWILLILSYGVNPLPNGIISTDVDTLSVKDLSNTMIVRDENGYVTGYQVKAKKEGLWGLLLRLLERRFGKPAKKKIEEMIRVGKNQMEKEADEAKASGKKKNKSKPSAIIELHCLKAFARIPVLQRV